ARTDIPSRRGDAAHRSGGGGGAGSRGTPSPRPQNAPPRGGAGAGFAPRPPRGRSFFSFFIFGSETRAGPWCRPLSQSAAAAAALVPRTRSSHYDCRESGCELRVQSGTRIIELLVSFDSEVRFGVCGELRRTSESGH